ncbi:hypothetical protein [Antarctobacter sp.]|uniref:hypothetical protein n=1 Tax=Antarctobacter sp. TaxID=1872577 RepID=UPI002B275083|nr:hypothetical protein [Antarctobacter sp.]
MRTLFAAAIAVLFALPAVADETEGLVLAYDRKADLLVLTDKTIWQLPSGIDVPADLGAGDRVLLSYETAGEDGLTAIDSLTRLSIALRDGEDGGS